MEPDLIKTILSDSFPQVYISNLGGGTVGTICLYRNTDGRVERAEADLYGAPFKKMLITAPSLLKMFGDNCDCINISALEHPWPELRLVGLHSEDFDVSVLQRAQYVRSHNPSGIDYLGNRPTCPRVKPNPAFFKKSNTQNLSKSKSKSKSRRRDSQQRSEEHEYHCEHAATTEINFDPKSLPNSSAQVKSKVDTALIDQEMKNIKIEIFERLEDKNRKQYNRFITTGVSRSLKEGRKFRDKLRQQMLEWFLGLGEKCGEVVRLHNRYASRQRMLNRKWASYLPIFEDLEGEHKTGNGEA